MLTHLDQPSDSGARPNAGSFACEVVPERHTARVVVIGELDIATRPELAARLDELRSVGFESVVLDLRRLTFLDCRGLRLIHEWSTSAARGTFAFQVIPGPPAVQRIFELTRTASDIDFVPPAPSALSAQRRRAATQRRSGRRRTRPGGARGRRS